MENSRLALIGILVSKLDSAGRVNAVLHEYADMVIGRMGVPYKEKAVSIISVAVDGEADRINALTGKLGQIDGVKSKALWQ